MGLTLKAAEEKSFPLVKGKVYQLVVRPIFVGTVAKEDLLGVLGDGPPPARAEGSGEASYHSRLCQGGDSC
jgi:hypothetical protein